MLSKTDLSAIRTIVREEVEAEAKSTREDLQGEVKLARIEIQKDVRSLADKVKSLEVAVGKIQKDIKSVVNFFDKDALQLRKQVERIREHLNLPSIQ